MRACKPDYVKFEMNAFDGRHLGGGFGSDGYHRHTGGFFGPHGRGRR